MTRIIAVTSGKGGVGKTHLSVNLALQCARKGLRTCLFDADLGLANVNLLLKLDPQRTLGDVIAGDCRLQDIVMTVAGIDIIPGSSGVAAMADLAPAALRRIGAEFRILSRYDLIIFDTSSGVSDTVLAFVNAAPETLLVVTPEPTALTDAYALVKLLLRRRYAGRLEVVVNQAQSEAQARHTYEKFREVVRVYQGVDVHLLGAVPVDVRVAEAVCAQTPFSLSEPLSGAGLAVGVLADRLLESGTAATGGDSLDDFWLRLTGMHLPAEEVTPRDSTDTAPATESEPRAPSDASVPTQAIMQRLDRLESGLAAVMAALQPLRMPVAPAPAPPTLSATEAGAPVVTPIRPERRGGNRRIDDRKGADRRAGGPGSNVEPLAPARFVRNAERATPIDALQLRRVVGRMLVKAMPGSEAVRQPVQIEVEQMQLESGNDFSLQPGRYTRIALHCQHIRSPDAFIEEIFTNCAITGCKVRHLGSHVRYWLTSGRDGCIVLDGDDGDRNCVQIYMAGGGNQIAEDVESAAGEPPLLRRLRDGWPETAVAPGLLLGKFPHERLTRMDAEGEPLELFRLLRRDRSPLLCAFHHAGGETTESVWSEA
jgi:flagellar biosynthesis protein FlhG